MFVRNSAIYRRFASLSPSCVFSGSSSALVPKRCSATDNHDALATLVADRLLQPDVKRILFVTGAGMSAESGLPTYRGISGLYSQGLTEDGCSIEDAMSGSMLRERPEVCWKYLAQIGEACENVTPNAGHRAISQLQRKFDVWVLTQNIDGLHQAAGSTQVIPIHGDIHSVSCARCNRNETIRKFSVLRYNKPGHMTEGVFPTCDGCGAMLRPGVVLFGEMLDPSLVQTLDEQLSSGFDAVFSVGTTSVFPYIAEPVIKAAEQGIFTVEINPDLTPVSAFVEVRVPHTAAAFLEVVAQKVLMDTRSSL